MAEPKKKANNDGVSPATPSKGSRFAGTFNKFILLCTEMKNDSAGAADYEKTLDENATLKSTLKMRDEEVDSLKARVGELQRLKDSYIVDFERRITELNARVEEGDNAKRMLDETREKLAKTEKELKTLKATYNQLEKKARDEETARERAEADLEDEQQQRTRLQRQLNVMQKTISLYGEDRLTPRDPSEMEDSFQSFAAKCHRAVMECFLHCDAPPKNIHTLKTHLKNCIGQWGSELPLSDSTSRPARLMRCAAAECVVINALVNHIFTDVHIPGAVDIHRAVSTTLDHLSNDPRRESIVRCQLLAISESQGDNSHGVAQASSKEICSVLDDLLPAGEPRKRWQAKLAGLLNDAAVLWHTVQTSLKRVSPRLSLDAQILERLDRDEDSYGDYDSSSGREAARPGSPTSTKTRAVLLLFPMICMSGHATPVFRPIALWSDQDAYVEARNELSQGSMSINASGVGLPDPARLQSTRRRNSIRKAQTPVATASSSSGAAAGSDVAGGQLVPSRRTENGIKSTGTGR